MHANIWISLNYSRYMLVNPSNTIYSVILTKFWLDVIISHSGYHS